ncbi:50S ribosomal protein L30 [Candidatus Woesearchaeota archaeon CG10_big_fil_rev_8_21_14_0_10_32_9]|nr:MAG: 50S ribosomal protein L30 [Candidatus Woesearchaeota archaeon CG10_big_fil_rev_8_21_14_0_10_32_9]
MEEIRKLLGSEKLILGKERTLKELRKGNLQKVFIASNLDEQTKKDLEYYQEINNFELVNSNMTNEELGTLCRKPFSIAVMGLLK